MRFIARIAATVVSSAAFVGLPLTAASAAPTQQSVAPSSSMSQGYFLYAKHAKIPANCLGGNRYVGEHKVVKIKPWVYRQTKHVKTPGIYKKVQWHQQGFNSALRKLYCQHGDFVWRYYGQNAVARTMTTWYQHRGNGLAYLFTSSTGWKNSHWA